MRLGVFGGTFDPPHVGHLAVASEVHAVLGLDRLLIVPSAVPPHKRGLVQAPARQRLEMVRAAVAADARFEADDLELRRSGPSYTVDTLRELHQRFPGCEIFFVVGVDQIRELHTWREPEEVARLACLAVVERGGEPLPEEPRFRMQRVPIPRIDVSSTEIRRRVAAGEPIRYLVTDPVREIIEREELYK